MDIYFRHDRKCFNFRVSAVIKNDNRILLSHYNNVYTLPGGRVHFGETTEQSIKRIIQNELNVNVKIIKLLSINENFFEYGDDDYHELLFVYLCELEPSIQEDLNDQYNFFTVAEMIDLNIKPEFLLTELKKLSGNISHYINKVKRYYLFYREVINWKL